MSTAGDLCYGHNDIPYAFTFVWKITNFKFCTISKGSRMESPKFLDTLNYTWQLCLYPRGNCDTSVECHFVNHSRCPLPPKCHFCVCSTELEVLFEEETHLFAVVRFEREVFEKLSDDALVLHCHFWKCSSIKVKDMVHCFAVTPWCLQLKIFSWKVENFSSLKLGETITYKWDTTIKSDTILNSKLLILGQNLPDSTVQIWLTFENMSYQPFTSFALFLTDENGSVVKYLKKEGWLGPTEYTMKFSLDRAVIIAAGLSNGNLIVRGEVKFSGDPSDYKGSIEGKVYGMKMKEAVAAIAGSHISYSQPTQPLSLENFPSLSADMLSLYRGEGPPSDFQLNVAGRMFPVHQLVLGARSAVFHAMFTNDMLERSKRSLELIDIDADTTERMLTYIYTDKKPPSGLDSESLADLYAAADKYALLGLKEICAQRLVQGLTLFNAPDVLKIAHQHEDPLLKKSVVDYIISQGLLVIESEIWKELEKADPQLSNEVLHLNIGLHF